MVSEVASSGATRLNVYVHQCWETAALPRSCLELFQQFHSHDAAAFKRGKCSGLRSFGKWLCRSGRQRAAKGQLRVITDNRFIEKVLAIERDGQALDRCYPGEAGIKHVGFAHPAKIIVAVSKRILVLEAGADGQIARRGEIDIPDEAEAVGGFRDTRDFEVSVIGIGDAVARNVGAYLFIGGVDQSNVCKQQDIVEKPEGRFGFNAGNVGIGSVQDELGDARRRRRDIHLALHVFDLVQEGGEVEAAATVRIAVFQSDFVGIDALLVEGGGTCLRNLLLEDGRIGDAEIVPTRPEAPGVGAVGLHGVAECVLKPDFRRHIRPVILVGNIVRAGRVGDGALAGPWYGVGNVGVLFLIGVTQAENDGERVGQAVIALRECAPDQMVLSASAREGDGGDGRQEAMFGIGNFLIEIEQAGCQFERAERSGISQLI